MTGKCRILVAQNRTCISRFAPFEEFIFVFPESKDSPPPESPIDSEF